MTSDSLKRRVDELTKLVKDSQSELQQLEELQEQFPDLEVIKDRWGTMRFSAESANKLADNYYTKFGCGCCNDSPKFLYPYTLVNDVKVHTKPERVCIGEKDYYLKSGARHYSDLCERYDKYGLSAEIMRALEMYSKIEPTYEEDDEDDDWI
jgi:hypothetical protein